MHARRLLTIELTPNNRWLKRLECLKVISMSGFDYQPHKNNDNWLPQPIWEMTLKVVRNYDFNRQRHQDILEQSKSVSDIDGLPHGTNRSDEVIAKVEQAEVYFNMVRAVDQALTVIPEEYREGVKNKLMYKTPDPNYAHPNTWKKYRGIFMRKLAKNMNFI